MRILIAGINYRPEVTGIGPYTAGLAEHVVRCGHDVVVSTTFPHYPQWEWQPPMARWSRTDPLDGVEVRRTRVILPRRAGARWRIAYDTSFAAGTLLRSTMVRRPDLVLCISPPVQAAFSCALLARKWRVPLVLLLQDLPLQAALSVGMMSPGAACRLGNWIERRAYGLAEKIVVINASFRRSLADQGVPAHKVVEIPNWANLDYTAPGAPEPEMRQLLGAPNGEFLVLHCGNMGEKQGLRSAVLAAQIVSRRREVRLALVGDGAERRVLERMVVENDIRSVRLLPLQPAAVFPRMLASADALLLHQRAEVTDSVVPSKLLTYMAAAKPILAAASANSPAARLVSEARCGLVVRPDDPSALADAMDELSGDAHRRRALGLAGRQFVQERFQRKAILKEWELLLEGVRRAFLPG
jgi:putative colanic acid biosynthesis glycosyltransferase WcaI